MLNKLPQIITSEEPAIKVVPFKPIQKLVTYNNLMKCFHALIYIQKFPNHWCSFMYYSSPSFSTILSSTTCSSS